MISKEALVHKVYEDSERFRKFLVREVNTDPTDKQKESENYKKAHITLWGLRIAIENPKGSIRSGGDDSNGNAWANRQYYDYGYIKSTMSNDKKNRLSVYIGNPEKYQMIYVVNQSVDKTKGLYKHTCMIGFMNESAARKAYVKNYDYGWNGFDKELVAFEPEQFKQWIKMPGVFDKKAINPFTKVYNIDRLTTKPVLGSSSKLMLSTNNYVKSLKLDILRSLPVAVLVSVGHEKLVKSFIKNKFNESVDVIDRIGKDESIVDLGY